MGRFIFFLFLLLVAGVISLALIAQPNVPKVNPTKVDKALAKLCLQDIPKYYQAHYLTYGGHIKAWYLRLVSKLGLNLNEKEKQYLIGYSFLEQAVNCYITSSGDSELNMTLSPAEFETIFKSVSKDYGISKRSGQ